MKRCTDPTARARSMAACGLAFTALGSLLATDCTSNHDALAARPKANGGSAGKAGAGGSAGRGGTGGTGSTGGSSAQGGSGGTGGSKPVLPTGRSVLTLLHAIVDAPRVALCFAKTSGGTNTLIGEPRPADGIAYGRALVVESVSGVDHAEEGLVPYALAGDLDLVAGLDCEEAVARAEEEMRAATQASAAAEISEPAGGAGGEAGAVSGSGGAGGEPGVPMARLRVGALPELGPGVLTEGYSLLYAAVGCLGGVAYTHPDEREICGDIYTPMRSSLSAELVVVSRTVKSDVVALQALHASRGFGLLSSVRIAPPQSMVLPGISVGDMLSEGALRPREPRTDVLPASYGIGEADYTVDALVGGSPVVSDPWPLVLERSALPEPEVGRGYTLVLMGPAGQFGTGWWNPAGFALVDNDPMP